MLLTVDSSTVGGNLTTVSSPDMLMNSSFNDSDQLSTGGSSLSTFAHCLVSRPSSFIFMTVDLNIVFLMLPLCLFILRRGLTDFLKRRSSSVSHSDCFTYHMVTMEMIGVVGYVLNFSGIYSNDLKVIFVGGFFTSTTWFGQIFFHVLTCVERYLAVVHPVSYLSLRNERGVRIRNASAGGAWLLSFVGTGLMMMTSFFSIMDLCLLVFSLTVVSFCSVSALCVLIRPGPGEQVKGREGVDQSKRRAFYTIVSILGVLLVRFTFNVVWEVIFMTGRRNACVLMAVCVWFNVPSCLVLPLLYLHRAGTLEGCKNRIKGGDQRELQGQRTAETSETRSKSEETLKVSHDSPKTGNHNLSR